jgi:N-acetylmuramoyl-L-alanine amidase
VADAFGGDFKSKSEIQSIAAASQPAFATLKGVHAPTIVVNIPFSENDGMLLSPDGRQKIADSLYRGVAAFVKEDPSR